VSQDSFSSFFFLSADPCVLAGPPLSPPFLPHSWLRLPPDGQQRFFECLTHDDALWEINQFELAEDRKTTIDWGKV
jgi:hypothetical protein